MRCSFLYQDITEWERDAASADDAMGMHPHRIQRQVRVRTRHYMTNAVVSV